jgi:uncharacterized protein (DUF952 family)
MNDSSQKPHWIYHITPRETWENAALAGIYQGDTLATEGYIHTSTREQVLRTANSFYHGRSGLVLLEIDADKVDPEIRYEAAPTGEMFPHIYGPLDPRAVIRVYDFPSTMEGTFQWPEQSEVL